MQIWRFETIVMICDESKHVLAALLKQKKQNIRVMVLKMHSLCLTLCDNQVTMMDPNAVLT